MIAVVTFAVFTPVLFSAFSPVDDQSMLALNKSVTQPTWSHVADSWTHTTFRIYMPLPLTIWQGISALTYQSGTAPGSGMLPALGFKIASIVCHCGSAMAAAWTLSILLRQRWPAIIGAMLFALHPFQVESVAWATGLKDILCGLFAILSIGSYVRFARRDPISHWNDLWWWTAFGFMILAVLCKPTAMTLCVLLFVVDWFARECGPVRRVAALLPFLLLALACGFVVILTQGNTAAPRVPAYLQPLVALDSYSFYLRHLFLPWRMCVDYARGPVRTLDSGALFWTWAIPLAVFVALLIARSRVLWLAAALFAIPILPTSGILPFDMQQYSTVADHYMYQPMLGVALAVAFAVSRWRDWASGVALACVAVCAVFSWRYATIWRTPQTLFTYTHQVNPNSWMAQSVLSNIALSNDDPVKAKKLVDQVLKIDPEAGPAWDTLSRLEVQRGQYRAAAEAALKACRYTLLPVELAQRVTTLGAALQDRDLAKKGVRAWLRAEPDNPTAWQILRNIEASERADAATRPTSAP